jgi:hypothetical protein
MGKKLDSAMRGTLLKVLRKRPGFFYVLIA